MVFSNSRIGIHAEKFNIYRSMTDRQTDSQDHTYLPCYLAERCPNTALTFLAAVSTPVTTVYMYRVVQKVAHFLVFEFLPHALLLQF